MNGEPAPPGIDTSRAHPARVYDYYLGGAHNFAVDRAVAEQTLRLMPGLDKLMQANRAFLRRSVRLLVGMGVRQFLDLGAGIPTVGNVHEIAQGAAPESRVVYVDKDPVAVAHSQVMLEDNTGADVLLADMRDVQSVLADVDALALRLKTRLPPDAPVVHKLRSLNRYFFEELGFSGNVNDYHDPANSYLPDVLTRRREPYHLPPAGQPAHGEATNATDGTPSIHDLEQAARLQRLPPIDPRDRALFVDRVLASDVTLDAYANAA